MMMFITGAPNGCNEFFVTGTVGDSRLIKWITDLAQTDRCTGGLLPEPQEWSFVISDNNTTDVVATAQMLGGVVVEQLSPEFANVVFRCVLPVSYHAYEKLALHYTAFARIERDGSYRLVLFRDLEQDPSPLEERLIKGPHIVQDLFIEDDNIAVIGSERARLLALQ